MNWIEVKDIKELPYNNNSILAQDEYGNIGYVYWDSYNWVYDVPYRSEDDPYILPGKIVKYATISN